MSDDIDEVLARIIHEAEREYMERELGQRVQTWEEAPEFTRTVGIVAAHAVRARLEHDIRIKTLRDAISILEVNGVEPWNRNLQAIKILRSLADFIDILDKRFRSGQE